MGKVAIPYYVVKKGYGYWQPTRHMRALGFASVPCGQDGPGAWKRAREANDRWQRYRAGEEVAPDAANADPKIAEVAVRYPRGSIGEAWQRYIRTEAWQTTAESNRNRIWWPAWLKRIKPFFGDVDPNTITFEDMSAWRAVIQKRDGIDGAHKALKVWRAFWGVLQGMHYTALEDPSKGIRNKAPKPRHQRWSEGEVVRLVKAAWRSGYRGLACIIAATWDTTFQPGDVRTLRARHLGLTRDGLMVLDRTEEGRAKTGVAALGTVCPRTAWLIAEYLDGLGVELHEEAFLFRNRSGDPYRMDTLGDDFAAVRAMVFPGDKRQLRDMRRSGATEAVAGAVDPAALSAKLANSISQSDRLWKTYVKVDEVAVRAADAARLKGRRSLRENKAQRKTGAAVLEHLRAGRQPNARS